MARFSCSTNGLALSTSADYHTLVTAATGVGSVLKVYEFFLAGEAGSSAVVRVAINRPSAVGITIGATVQTPVKVNPASGVATFTVAGSASAVSSWSTQPAITADDVLTPTFNAFGGAFRWIAPPDSEVVVGAQGAVANLIFRSRSGTSTCSGHILVEEC
jgi:hypothetical protein